MNATALTFRVLTIEPKSPPGHSDTWADWPGLAVPDFAVGYVPGHTDLLATASLGPEGVIVGAAGASILCHPVKAPLLRVDIVSIEYRDLDPELDKKLLTVLAEAAREKGCLGIWVTERAKTRYRHERRPS